MQALRAVNNASGPFDENLAPTPPGDEAACILGVCVCGHTNGQYCPTYALSSNALFLSEISSELYRYQFYYVGT